MGEGGILQKMEGGKKYGPFRNHRRSPNMLFIKNKLEKIWYKKENISVEKE